MFSLPSLKLGKYYGGAKQQEKRKDKSFKKLSLEDLSKDNRTLIEKIYKDDFELWNEVKKHKILII